MSAAVLPFRMGGADYFLRMNPWTCEACEGLGFWTTQDAHVAHACGTKLMDGYARIHCPDCSGTGYADFLLAAVRTPKFVKDTVRTLEEMLADHPGKSKQYILGVWYRLYVREFLRSTKRILRLRKH